MLTEWALAADSVGAGAPELFEPLPTSAYNPPNATQLDQTSLVRMQGQRKLGQTDPAVLLQTARHRPGVQSRRRSHRHSAPGSRSPGHGGVATAQPEIGRRRRLACYKLLTARVCRRHASE